MPTHKALYDQRVEEIVPNIRYCAYNIGDGSADIEELMKLRMTAGDQDLLAGKIDVGSSRGQSSDRNSLFLGSFGSEPSPAGGDDEGDHVARADGAREERESARLYFAYSGKRSGDRSRRDVRTENGALRFVADGVQRCAASHQGRAEDGCCKEVSVCLF